MERMVRIIRTITVVQDVPTSAYNEEDGEMSEAQVHDLEITLDLADVMDTLGGDDSSLEVSTIVQFYGGDEDKNDLPAGPRQY